MASKEKNNDDKTKKKDLKKSPREDGEEQEDLTARFRRELRASLLIAMIQGTSAILNAAGLPQGFKPKAAVVAPPRAGRPLLASPWPPLRTAWRTAKFSTATALTRATAAAAPPPVPTVTPSTIPPARCPDAPPALRSSLGWDSSSPPSPRRHPPTSRLIWQVDFPLF